MGGAIYLAPLLGDGIVRDGSWRCVVCGEALRTLELAGAHHLETGHPIADVPRYENPWRAPYLDAGAGFIDLRGPESNGPGHCIHSLPSPVDDPRLDLLGEHPGEPLSRAAIQAIQNRFGLTLKVQPGVHTLAHALAELFTDPDHHGDPKDPKAKRWHPLRPSVEHSRFEMHLGHFGVIWTLAVPPWHNSKILTETWPNITTANPMVEDRTWNNSATNLLKTLNDGTRNYVTPAVAGQTCQYYCGTALDTTDHYHSCTADIGAGITQESPSVRHSTSAVTFYFAKWKSNTTSNRQLLKTVAGSQTTLTSDSTNPTAPFALTTKAVGSTITGTWGSTGDLSATDTAITSGNNCGVIQLSSTNVGDSKLYNNRMADVPQALAVSGSLTSSGVIGNVTARGLAGSLTSAGTPTKATNRGVSGSTTPTGGLAKVLASVYTRTQGGVTLAGTLTKSLARALTGSLTSTGTFAGIFSGIYRRVLVASRAAIVRSYHW